MDLKTQTKAVRSIRKVQDLKHKVLFGAKPNRSRGIDLLQDFPKDAPERSVMHPFHAITSGSGVNPQTGKKLSQKEEDKLWVDYGKAVKKYSIGGKVQNFGKSFLKMMKGNK